MNKDLIFENKYKILKEEVIVSHWKELKLIENNCKTNILFQFYSALTYHDEKKGSRYPVGEYTVLSNSLIGLSEIKGATLAFKLTSYLWNVCLGIVARFIPWIHVCISLYLTLWFKSVLPGL